MQKNSQKISLKRTGVLTPVEGADSSNKTYQRKTSFLKGHAITLRTRINPCEYELGFIPNESDITTTDCPSLTQLQAMFGIVQQTLPKQFISSNRAETFNALHDRYNVYWGRKSLLHANRDVRAWTAVTFFSEGRRILLQRHKWHIPYRLLVFFFPLLISKVGMR